MGCRLCLNAAWSRMGRLSLRQIAGPLPWEEPDPVWLGHQESGPSCIGCLIKVPGGQVSVWVDVPVQVSDKGSLWEAV